AGPPPERAAAELGGLGPGEPHPVSALPGRGTGDLLDAAMAALPTVSQHATARPGGPRRVALVGRPNLGKSSLLNKVLGTGRVG
ncbi:GTPase, partial [Cellulomonas sp. GbtcB1]|uniref:GTPase n=1 Tax=Cellulomonas sp. GbtcB1 TaxID=2824746 RepID=UPI001C302291